MLLCIVIVIHQCYCVLQLSSADNFSCSDDFRSLAKQVILPIPNSFLSSKVLKVKYTGDKVSEKYDKV